MMQQAAAATGFPPFTVGIVLYDDCDLLDIAGPNEVFTFFGMIYGAAIKRSVRIITLAQEKEPPGPRIVEAGGFKLLPAYTFQQERPAIDLLFVPGGGPQGLLACIDNKPFLDFLRGAAATAQYVTSVCTGGLLLASAGLLDGYQGTAHWSVVDCLKLFPKVTVPDGYPRWVPDRNRITGGGISSSIDESLYMVERIATDLTGDASLGREASRGVQLAIQYHPDPPNTPPLGGDPDHVDPALLAKIKGGMAGFHDAVCAAVARRIAQR